MEPSVIISQLGGFHARPAAEAASAAGLLERFIAAHPQGVQVPSEQLLDLFYTVQPLRGFSLLGRKSGIGYFSKLAGHYSELQRWYFDRRAISSISDKTKIFHAYSCYQEEAWNKCDKNGVYKVIEHGTAHPLFDAGFVGAEYDAYSQKNTYRESEWMDRMLAEHSRVDRIYVISEFARSTFKKYSPDYDKVVVNRLGVDTDLFHPLPEFEGHRRDRSRPLEIMAGGYVCLRKGTHYLLEAVKGLKKNKMDCRLSLYGAVLDFADVLSGYDGVVDHLGSVHLPQLIEKYNLADVLVLPSLSEGFGRVVTEAMACGTVCIVSENTGAAEVITDGVDGFVVPVRDSEAITEKLEMLYRDRELVVAMGERARATALENTWREYQQRLIDDYKEILSGDCR